MSNHCLSLTMSLHCCNFTNYDVTLADESTHPIIEADGGVIGFGVDIDDDVNHISDSYSLGEVVELKGKGK